MSSNKENHNTILTACHCQACLGVHISEKHGSVALSCTHGRTEEEEIFVYFYFKPTQPQNEL